MTNRKDWPLALSRPVSLFDDAVLADMRNAGIRYAELSTGDFKPYYEKINFPRDSVALCRRAAEAGVTVSSLHLPFEPGWVNPAGLDVAERARYVEMQSELIEAASACGIGIVVVHPSREPHTEEERAERLAIAIDSIGKLTEKASACGVTLALENLPRTCLCRTHEEMEAFLAAVPELRVCFDLNHCLLEPNVEYIRAVGDKIVTLHVSDYDFIDEKHWLPGVGKNPWGELLSALEEIDYNGKFTYETGGASPAEVAENYRWLMSL